MRSHINRNPDLFPVLGPNPEPHGSIFYSRPESELEPVYVLVSEAGTGIFKIIPVTRIWTQSRSRGRTFFKELESEMLRFNYVHNSESELLYISGPRVVNILLASSSLVLRRVNCTGQQAHKDAIISKVHIMSKTDCVLRILSEPVRSLLGVERAQADSCDKMCVRALEKVCPIMC